MEINIIRGKKVEDTNRESLLENLPIGSSIINKKMVDTLLNSPTHEWKDAADKVHNLIVRINNNVWTKTKDSYIRIIAQIDNFQEFELMSEITEKEFMKLVFPWLRIFKPKHNLRVLSELLMGRPNNEVNTSSSRGVAISTLGYCLCLGFWPRHQKGIWVANTKAQKEDTYCEILFPQSTIEISENESPEEYELFDIEKLKAQGRLLPDGINGGTIRSNSWGNKFTIISKSNKVSVHNTTSICIF